MAFSLSAGRLQDSGCTEEYKEWAEWNLSLYIRTTLQTRQSSDTNPSNTSAVPDCPCLQKATHFSLHGNVKGKKKTHICILLASGWARFCFCNASLSVNRTDSAVINYSWNSCIAVLIQGRFSQAKICKVLPQMGTKFSEHTSGLTHTDAFPYI